MTSPQPELNVIACQRCRRKKIRCDREKPVCKRCRHVSVDCLYEPPRFSKRKHRDITGSDVDPSASSNNLRPLNTLENTVRNSAASSIPPLSINSPDPSLIRSQHAASSTPYADSQNPHPRLISMWGYKFRADPETNLLDQRVFIPLETAVAWVHAFYANQSTMGLLLPISKDFMLTIPHIIDNPYVQVDVRVLILYYGALHDGMQLNPGLSNLEKSKFSLYFYRKSLQLMEQWQYQDQVNDLSLHVAFWMAHISYSQLDFDLSHRLHGFACQIASSLGLFELDSGTLFHSSSVGEISSWSYENPRSSEGIDATYRDVHRIYFWHILVKNDYSYRHHLYKSGNIDFGTWKVDIPDFSHRKSLSSIEHDTEVYFEVSLRLTFIQLKYSRLESSQVSRGSEDGSLSQAEQGKLRDLLLEVNAVISECQVERLLTQASSKINARLYTYLIWRATSMITLFLRIQRRSAAWPTEHDKQLEYTAAHRSIWALQRLLDIDQDALYWNLGYFKCFFTPSLSVLFENIFTSTSEGLANLSLTLWVQTIVSQCANERHELKSLELFLQTLNNSAQLVIQQRFPSFRTQARTYWDGQSALPQTVLPASTGKPKEGQVFQSGIRQPSPLTLGSLQHEHGLAFYGSGIDTTELSNEPHWTILSLEKSLLTESDPHSQWWDFES